MQSPLCFAGLRAHGGLGASDDVVQRKEGGGESGHGSYPERARAYIHAYICGVREPFLHASSVIEHPSSI